MVPIGTTIPESWIKSLQERGISNFSAHLRDLIGEDVRGHPSIQVKKNDIQTNIVEICETLRPRDLVRDYFNPALEISVENLISDLLRSRYGREATPTEISVAMNALQRGACLA